MDRVKPIETIYKGYRFRSRLEAKWAIFLEHLQVKFEYEIEGFDLGKHGYYLPDFWLPEFKCWVEIKPGAISYDISKKMIAFADNVAPIICFMGSPDLGWNGIVYCHDTTDSSGGIYENKIGFAWCHKCKKATLSLSDEDTRFIRGARTLHNHDWTAWNDFCDPEHRDSHTIGELAEAINASRQARFEFGEGQKGIL